MSAPAHFLFAEYLTLIDAAEKSANKKGEGTCTDNDGNTICGVYEFTVSNPTRLGYTFTGWTSDEIATPTKAVVIVNGRIATIGGPEVIQRIDKEGYEWIEDELGISIKKEEKKPVLLETCAVKDKMHE